jgi:UPF0176 protein
MKFQVLLYYKYITIQDLEKVLCEQKDLCRTLNLKGRIILASEGINGTVEGSVEETEQYVKVMQSSILFQNISFKKSQGTGNAFKKLSVKVRPEVVTTGIQGLYPNQVTGKYITASELHTWFEEKREFYLIDMRNEYEYISGYFKNFIPSGMNHFRELSQVLPRLLHLKNKTIVTVCTGGIRCEKASGFLLLNGFKNVYQLQDGIQAYMEKYPNEHFKGKLYVFDNRLTIGFGSSEIVGSCMHCHKASERYVNCEYDICHKHYICCADCIDSSTGFAFCHKECKDNYLLQRKQRASVKASFVHSL